MDKFREEERLLINILIGLMESLISRNESMCMDIRQVLLELER